LLVVTIDGYISQGNTMWNSAGRPSAVTMYLSLKTNLRVHCYGYFGNI